MELKDPWGLSSSELLEAKARDGGLKNPELVVETDPNGSIRYEIDDRGVAYLELKSPGMSDADLLTGICLVAEQLTKALKVTAFPLRTDYETACALQRFGFPLGERIAVRKQNILTSVGYELRCDESFRKTLADIIEKRF